MASKDPDHIDIELDETAVDLDALDETGADATGFGSCGLTLEGDPPPSTSSPATPRPARVPEKAEANAELTADQILAGMDPERDSGDVAVQRTVRKQIASEGGQFVLGSIILVLAIGVAIMAITTRESVYVIVACITAPPAMLFFVLRWKQWLGQAPYLYRLLTSLGEDADDVLEAHQRKMDQKAEIAQKKAELKAAKILHKHRNG